MHGGGTKVRVKCFHDKFFILYEIEYKKTKIIGKYKIRIKVLKTTSYWVPVVVILLFFFSLNGLKTFPFVLHYEFQWQCQFFVKHLFFIY